MSHWEIDGRGVSDGETSNSPAVHRLCILDDASSRGESVQFENYTDTPDFNVVHSEVLFQQQPDTDELRSISIVNSMPQLLEQPESKPSAFMYLINF